MRLFLLLFLSLLSACSSTGSDDVAKHAVAYYNCQWEDSFLKYLGIEREECKELHKLLFEQAIDKCADDFYSDKLSKDNIDHLVNSCTVNWLDRQYLDISKEYSIYQQALK